MSTSMVAIPLSDYLNLLEDRNDLGVCAAMCEKLLDKADLLSAQNDACGLEIRRLQGLLEKSMEVTERAVGLSINQAAEIETLTQDLERERSFSDSLQQDNQDLAASLALSTCIHVGLYG